MKKGVFFILAIFLGYSINLVSQSTSGSPKYKITTEKLQGGMSKTTCDGKGEDCSNPGTWILWKGGGKKIE